MQCPYLKVGKNNPQAASELELPRSALAHVRHSKTSKDVVCATSAAPATMTSSSTPLGASSVVPVATISRRQGARRREWIRCGCVATRQACAGCRANNGERVPTPAQQCGRGVSAYRDRRKNARPSRHLCARSIDAGVRGRYTIGLPDRGDTRASRGDWRL